jgi:hypothetical protein
VHSSSEASESEQTYPLVAPGRHGAEQIVAEFTGKQVRLRGTLIQRDEGRMLEVIPSSITTSTEKDAHPAAENILGKFTPPVEIVDSKCFLAS